MMRFDPMTVTKLIGMIALYLFLPFTALTYYIFRRDRRTAEIERILAILNIGPNYRKAYHSEKSGAYLLWTVAYTSVVSCLGLAVLFLGAEIGLDALPPVQLNGVQFPHEGSRFVFGMAFLGAYLWGLQYIFRRYALNDLIPTVYYDVSIRMILAATIALVIYNVYEALAGSDGSSAAMSASLWPALAFMIGMFPDRGLRWLTDRLPILASGTDPSVREAPLEMIEGIELDDVFRLEELGIDTCYDLATADFVPLILRTPYSARQVVDWILQAKLCVYFGDAVKDLRQRGIRTIMDLEALTPEDVQALISETPATKYALTRARESVQNDAEIKRLRTLGQVLSRFWERQDETVPPPK